MFIFQTCASNNLVCRVFIYIIEHYKDITSPCESALQVLWYVKQNSLELPG